MSKAIMSNKFSFFTFLIITFICLTNLMAEENVTKKPKLETATFAAGCFWCIQPPFDKAKGVISTTVGFSGGKEKDPTYQDVAYGRTSHLEAINVIYDPTKITYGEIFTIFLKNHDPYDGGGQFCDRGKHYRPAVFYHNEKQEKLAKKLLGQLKNPDKVKTEVVKFKKFYPAGEEHQEYYEKHPIRYKTYRIGCGRDRRLAEINK